MNEFPVIPKSKPALQQVMLACEFVGSPVGALADAMVVAASDKVRPNRKPPLPREELRHFM